jgi:prepilin-type N-terminal cleavage/methylation domain-containing protein
MDAEKLKELKFFTFNQKGFTLIEVILAFVILGIVAIGLISLFSYGVMHTYRSGMRTEVLYEGQSKVERGEGSTGQLEQLEITFVGVKIPIQIEEFEIEVKQKQSEEPLTLFFFEAGE